MRRPEPVWECEYKNDRRNHRHRCFCCNRIVEPGMRVLMCRHGDGTRTAHIECVDRPHGNFAKITTRRVMEIWGLQVLKRQGWKVTDEELREVA
jgi:hypothetical protein